MPHLLELNVRNEEALVEEVLYGCPTCLSLMSEVRKLWSKRCCTEGTASLSSLSRKSW